MHNQSISLIGFMGSGKTTIGKILANELDWNFKDLDFEISSRLNQSIPEIFQSYGEYYFRKKERKFLKELVLHSKTVLALGGGTVCFYDNMKILNKHSTSIYLKCSFEQIMSRLQNNETQRPLLIHKTESELESFVKSTIKQREQYYLKAHHIIENSEINYTISEINRLVK